MHMTEMMNRIKMFLKRLREEWIYQRNYDDPDFPEEYEGEEYG